MNCLPQEIEHFSAQAGVKLKTSETGFSCRDALDALKILDGTKVSVYGGDVYRREQHGWNPTYDNWHCERQSMESDLDFAARSRAKARDYISTYPTVDDSHLFVMVF